MFVGDFVNVIYDLIVKCLMIVLDVGVMISNIIVVVINIEGMFFVSLDII